MSLLKICQKSEAKSLSPEQKRHKFKELGKKVLVFGMFLLMLIFVLIGSGLEIVKCDSGFRKKLDLYRLA